jgi:hypothetical protein
MNNIIILIGQRVRSGTNFVGSTLSMHPDVVTIPMDKSLGEFNLFRKRTIKQVFDETAISSFGMELSQTDLKAYLKHYGVSWINFIKTKYEIPDHKVIFIKTYVIYNLDLWKMSFPEAKLAVICRDGRDNIISSVKASNDKRSWYNYKLKLKKKINYLSGRSFIQHSKHWASTANEVVKIMNSEEVKVFKYEELNDSKQGIEELLSYYGLRVDNEILNKCINAPVVGSSFRFNSTLSKPNWTVDVDKSKYHFTEKWGHWGMLKKSVFKIIASKAMKRLGYELDNNW